MRTPVQPLEELAVLREQQKLLLSHPQVVRGIVEAHCCHRWQANEYHSHGEETLRRQEIQSSGALLNVLASAGISLSRDKEDEEILHVYRDGKIIDSYHDGAAGWLIQCQACHGVVLESMTTWKNDRIVCEDCARA